METALNHKILLPVTNIKGEKADGFTEIYVDVSKLFDKNIRDYEQNGTPVKNRCVVFSSFQKKDPNHTESLIIELSKEELVRRLNEIGFKIK